MIRDADVGCESADERRYVALIHRICGPFQERQVVNARLSGFKKHFGPWSGVPDRFRELFDDNPSYADVLGVLTTCDKARVTWWRRRTAFLASS